MKKIAILLLLASNSFLVIANAEINACIAGVNARGGSSGGSVILLIGNEPQSACSGFKDVGTQAACIFGYNTMLPKKFESNVIPGNGCNADGIIGPCPDWWGYNPPDGAGKGCGGVCCVCEYPGTTDSGNRPDGYGVCQYGKAIGWNLSVSGAANTISAPIKLFGADGKPIIGADGNPVTYHIGNYYYNQQMLDGTGIINKLWGKNTDPNSKNRLVNWLNFIKNYINNIRSDGTNGLYGLNGLFSNYPNLNITISGADAVNRAS